MNDISISLNEWEKMDLGKIKYPGAPSEADIAFILQEKMRDLGLEARAQVKAKVYFEGRVRKAIMDLVVFSEEHEPMFVIEVKKGIPRHHAHTSKQVRKYRYFGLPVFVCRSSMMVDWVVDKISEAVEKRRTEKGVGG